MIEGRTEQDVPSAMRRLDNTRITDDAMFVHLLSENHLETIGTVFFFGLVIIAGYKASEQVRRSWISGAFVNFGQKQDWKVYLYTTLKHVHGHSCTTVNTYQMQISPIPSDGDRTSPSYQTASSVPVMND